MVHHYPLKIREHHLDTLGHVNNATYLSLFEEARWEMLSSRGYDMSYIHKTAHGPVILEIQIKFMRELRLREDIVITTELLSYKGKVGMLKQQMIQPDQSVASEAVFTFGLFDLRQRKLLEPTEDWLRVLGLQS